MSVLHLDIDAFFASVEQRDDPSLRGRPIAVGTGVVASCSYEARCFGVKTAMRLSEARRRCPRLLVLPGDYRRYEQAGRHVFAICHDATPQVEVAALDDLYLDLPDNRDRARSQPPPDQLAKTIQEQVVDEVSLSVSLGVGSNKLVAAIATQEAKNQRLDMYGGRLQSWGDQANRPLPPSPVITVRHGDEARYLAPWPVDILPGIGHATLIKLEPLRLRTVKDLAMTPIALLCGLLGKQGPRLIRMANGIDDRPVLPEKTQASIGRRASFDPPTSDREFLSALTGHLVDRATSWLRWNRQQTSGLKLFLRYSDQEGADKRTPLPSPTDNESTLREIARDTLMRTYTRRLPLRLLGVELAPLTCASEQTGLFPDPQQQRSKMIGRCKDDIRGRFGFSALQNGTSLILDRNLEKDKENYRFRTPCLTK